LVRLWSDKYNRFVYVNNQTRETSFLVREIDLKRMEQSKSKWSMPSMPSCSFLPAFTTVKNCLHRLRYTVCAVILASCFNNNIISYYVGNYRVLIIVVILSQDDTGFLRIISQDPGVIIVVVVPVLLAIFLLFREGVLV
jgi:hypothetical protein